MVESFRLHVVTPEGETLDERVVSVTAPGIQGEFGVLPRHARYVTALGVGELRYRTVEGEDDVLAVAGGFAEVTPETVNVLARTAEMGEEIDLARAKAALRRAEEKLASPRDEGEFERAAVELERARTRIEVAETRAPTSARTKITTSEKPIPGEEDDS